MRLWTIFLVLIASSVDTDAGATSNPLQVPKAAYKNDPAHSSVIFCVTHMELSKYCGRFTGVAGSVRFNGAQPTKSEASFAIDLNTVDSPSAELNKKLKRDFFETDRFPAAKFQSTSVTPTGSNTADVAGTLELHGVSQPVILKVIFNGGKLHPIANGYAIGFSAQTQILTSKFNFPDLPWRGFISDTVSISIDTELITEERAQ